MHTQTHQTRTCTHTQNYKNWGCQFISDKLFGTVVGFAIAQMFRFNTRKAEMAALVA